MSQHKNRIKAELKLELIEYFEAIQNEIDIHTQLALTELQENQYEWRQSILNDNEKMVQLVKEALESNLKRINEYEFENDSQIVDEEMFKENLKKQLIKKCCFYAKVESENLNTSLGFFLATDWYLDKKQLTLLKSKIQRDTFKNKSKEDDVVHLDSDALMLYYKLFNGYCCYYNDLTLKLYKKEIIDKLNHIEKLDINFDCEFNLELESNVFQHFKNLKWLSIFKRKYIAKFLKINVIELNSLPKLESLTIDCAYINIPSSLLRQLPKLKTLNLHRCLLGNDILNGLSLKDFSISISNQSNLDFIKANISFANLNSLEITCEKDNLIDLTVLDDAFAHMKHLETLKITIYKQEYIFDFAFENLLYLKTLYLNIPQLKYISRNGFKHLDNLINLTVIGSRKYSFDQSDTDSTIDDKAFEDLKDLKVLKLMVRNLPYLSKNFIRNLKNLEILKIEACNTYRIEDCLFKGLYNLKDLFIHIPSQTAKDVSIILKNDSFSDQLKLEYLTIELEGLENIEDDAFKGLESLKILKIKSDKLKKISKNILCHLKKLEKLSINQENKRTTVDLIIDEDTFQNLFNLTFLTFFVNKLSTININLFKNQKNLTKLAICVDSIGDIHEYAFSELRLLKLLSLRKLIYAHEILTSKELIQFKVKDHLGFKEDQDVKLEIRNDLAHFFSDTPKKFKNSK